MWNALKKSHPKQKVKAIKLSHLGVFIQWNGMMEWNSGMEQWNGTMEQNGMNDHTH